MRASAAMRAPFVVTFALGALGGCTDGGAVRSNDDAFNDAFHDTFDATSVTDVADAVDSKSTADASSDAGADGDANPSACPKDDPGFGPRTNPCSAPASILCSYPDGCAFRPADAGAPFNVYRCDDPGSGGRWTLIDDYVATCPTIMPSDRAACPCSPHMLYVACLFGTCEGLDRVYFDCQTADELLRDWKSTPVSCNPPEVDGGDADAATD